MAVRFDASGEDYTSTSSPPSGSAYTVTCWAKVSSDRNTWSSAWSSDSSTTNYSYLATDSDGVTMKWWTLVSGNERTISGPAMTVGTWYKFAAVVNGTDATLYYGSGLGALSSASAANWVTLSTSTTFRLGADPFAGEWLNGCVANVKHWSTNLALHEIERELLQYTPVRTANLVRYHPFVSVETTDYSGNARTLSGGTGTAREDGPPIPWQGLAPRLILPAAAAGGTTALAEVATGTATANDAQAAVSPGAEHAAATATAADPSPLVAPTGDTATATATAADPNPAVAPTGDTATATATAHDAATLVAPVVDVATATAAALDATTLVAPVVDIATATATAHDATVVTGAVTTASAGVAAATGDALDVSASVAVNAELADAASVSADAGTYIHVSADVATGTGAASDAVVATAVVALAESADASVVVPNLAALVAVNAEVATLIAAALDAIAGGAGVGSMGHVDRATTTVTNTDRATTAVAGVSRDVSTMTGG